MGFKKRRGREEEAGNEDLTQTIRSLWWSVMWKGVLGSRCVERHACSYIFKSVCMKYWHIKEWEVITSPLPPPHAPPFLPFSSHQVALQALTETTHTPTQPTTPLMWCGCSLSQTVTLQYLTYLSKRKSVCPYIFFIIHLFLTKRVWICLHSNQPFSDRSLSTGFDTNPTVSSLAFNNDTLFRQDFDRPCQQTWWKMITVMKLWKWCYCIYSR